MDPAARGPGYIGIADRATWGFYVWHANELARRPEFRRLAVAIADELERVEVLTAQDLEALIATAEETWSTEVCRCGCEGLALRGGSVGELGPEHCALSVFAS